MSSGPLSIDVYVDPMRPCSSPIFVPFVVRSQHQSDQKR